MVNIHAVERFLGDLAIEQNWPFDPPAHATEERVLVVGSGPSGLSAAYHLAKLGHHVTICEAESRPGGMMRFAIPQYRLPRNILDAEIARIQNMGVKIVLNRKVEDLSSLIDDGGFDAIFLAVGAHLSKRAYLPAGDAGKVLDVSTCCMESRLARRRSSETRRYRWRRKHCSGCCPHGEAFGRDRESGGGVSAHP